MFDEGLVHDISTEFSFRILNFKFEGGCTANKRWQMLNLNQYKHMYKYGFIYDQIKVRHFQSSIHIDPNDKHFMTEVDFVRCWGQTHSTDVHLWGWQVKNKWQHLKSVRSHFGVKWRLFELLNQDGQQLKHWHTQHMHDSTQTLPKCKHWVNHPTHAECSHYNACPDHILNCFYDGVDLSITKIKLIIQWNQGCHIVV